jgi:hypothetical protein
MSDFAAHPLVWLILIAVAIFLVRRLNDRLTGGGYPVPPPQAQPQTIIIQRRVGCLGHFFFGFIIAIIVIIGLIVAGGK